MFNFLKPSDQTKKQVYDFVSRQENYDKKMKILPVDFQKPWWQILIDQKKLLLMVMGMQFVWSIFDSLFPILIGFAITSVNFYIFVVICIVRFVLTLIYNKMFHYNAILQIQTMGSVEYQANRYFLTVDPIYHSTKSSGQIISKVQRGSAAYEQLLDIITFDLLGIITNFVTVVVVMFSFNWVFGLISLSTLIVIGGFNVVSNIIKTKIFESIKNTAQDLVKSVNIENLQQAPFIRAIFATREQDQKSKSTEFNAMVAEGNSWQASTYINIITRTLYIFSFFLLGASVFSRFQGGYLSSTVALSILLTYSNGTIHILHIGDRVKKLSRSVVAVVDLFDFIRSFGKQTYPVLEEDREK